MTFSPPWLRSILAAFVLSGSGLFFSGNSLAADFGLVDPQGKSASLDTFREDGKWTLMMLRYHACAPCDTAELALKQWFSAQDRNKVSVLVLNVDEGDIQASVVKRLEANGIDYPNFFTRDNNQVSEDMREITGKPLQGVPVWLFFANDGAFIASKLGPRFEWDIADDMIRSADRRQNKPSTESAAVETPKEPVKRRTRDDVRADGIMKHVTNAMVRGDMIRAESWLSSYLEKSPDHAGLLTEQVRYLMQNEREAAETPLGYRFSKGTEKRIQAALDTVLDADPKHPKALYQQAELHITQGRLQEASRAVQLAEELYIDARYGAYIKSLLLIMQEKPGEAVAAFDLLVNSSFRGPDQMYMFQLGWDQLKNLVIKHPEVDPLQLVRDGLVKRVAGSELLEEIKQRSKSDKPLMIIVTSEDPHCTYCLNNAADIDPFVRNNKDRYNFIYTSVEPWVNIKYQKWALVIPRISGLPKAVLFARSQFMITANLPVDEKQSAWHEENYPVLLSADPGVLNYKAREINAELSIARRHWLEVKGKVAAFAGVSTEDDFAWGASSVNGATQEEVNQRAMDLCKKYAGEKGIEKPCELYVEKAK